MPPTACRAHSRTPASSRTSGSGCGPGADCSTTSGSEPHTYIEGHGSELCATPQSGEGNQGVVARDTKRGPQFGKIRPRDLLHSHPVCYNVTFVRSSRP